MNFRKVNNLFGWLTGGIATIVYLMTMERTVSFWDCGEFLSCAYKLEVGHSPGAPLFMLLQRFFGIFADKHHAALVINSFSAIMSGGTILFLFWTITYFAKKLLTPNGEEPNRHQTAMIIGAGLVGGLAYTFSDTFWFSAVEAEVYATSSFFTAIAFWAILKWDNIADNRYADRWLLMIMYLVGLSIGIHLLNLLTIPAIAIVYYFRRYKPSVSGTIIAFIVGCMILGLIQFAVIQGIPVLASKFDVLFVNNFHMPFYSGAIFFLLLIVAAMIFLIRLARKKGYYLVHTGLLCLIFILIGFSSYIVPMIRSKADVSIDMTDPSNIPNLVSYVEREQFGEQPILSGPYFTDYLSAIDKKADQYLPGKRNGKDYYEVVGKKPDYKFSAYHFFPRIWDNNDESHIRFYADFIGMQAQKDQTGRDMRDDHGKIVFDRDPTSADNYKFFFGYQMNWMWWRYFMWNYVGRQNDFEGQGNSKDGNWASGLPAVDRTVGMVLGGKDLGDPNKMPDGYRNNRARNQLYYLPFILGILGLIYQFNRSRRQGFIVLTLFFFTGIAIGMYLNMPPLQPRERDYAFAGSTYAFAIWIGLGVLMVSTWLNKIMKGVSSTYAATGICLLAVPVLMASQEWNDHDRSKKSLAWATAYNTLSSCAPNAILFTFGDNDTYPLWYIQEVEDFRPDIRIINTSLLGIGWYIDQLNYKVNKADAVPMLWKHDDYVGDRRNYLRLVTHAQYPQSPDIPDNVFVPLADVCAFITSNDHKLPQQDDDDEAQNYFPTTNFYVPGPSHQELIAGGMLNPADSSRAIADGMRFNIGKNLIVKDDIAVLNIVAGVARDGWKRPIYFGGGLGDNYQGMNDYLRLEGTVFRLVPYKMAPDSLTRLYESQQDMGFTDLDKCISLFMNTYRFGGGERTDVYFDEKNKQMFMSYRLNAARIADELSVRGRKQEAIALLDKVYNGITERSYQYDYTALLMAMAYYHAGDIPKAQIMTKKIRKNCLDDISWIMSLNQNNRDALSREARQDVYFLSKLSETAEAAGDSVMAKELSDQVQAKSKQIIDGISADVLRAGM